MSFILKHSSRLDDLNSKQKEKFSDVLPILDGDNVVIKTIEKLVSDDGHCSHCNMINSKEGGTPG